MSEPVEDCLEGNEAEKSLGEFVVTSGDAAIDFDSAEEAFYLMTVPIVAAVEAGRVPAPASLRDAAKDALGTEAGPEVIGIKAFVRNDPTAASTGHSGATAC